MTQQHIGYVSLLVADYDEAISYFTKTLGFQLIRDVVIEDGKRWVVVAPAHSSECCLLLAKAKNQEERRAIGQQAGGRVFLFLHTDDFWHDYRTFLSRGVQFCEEPRDEEYGLVAVFSDLYGNRWDLLQLKEAEKATS